MRDTLEFSALRDVSPEIETYPLTAVNDVYDRLLENEARLRVVLEPGGDCDDIPTLRGVVSPPALPPERVYFRT